MIMPLDAALRPEHLTSTLHYLQRGSEKPARYRIEPPPGVLRWNGTDDPREGRIEDARGRESEFTLDRHGFALIKAPAAVVDFYDPDEIKRVYYPEVERLLRDALGASRVSAFDHNVRNARRAGMAALERLVDLAKLRWRIERDYQELKQELGLGHYEGRGWPGFHHHATLCIAAYAFLVAERAMIPPSGQRRAPQRATSGLPTSYRPRGTPDPAGTPRGALHHKRAAQAYDSPGSPP